MSTFRDNTHSINCGDLCKIELVSLSSGEYIEYCPDFSTKRNIAEPHSCSISILTEIIETRKQSENLPIVLRKKKMYEQAQKELKKENDNDSNDDIITFVNYSIQANNIPIILRKRVLYQKFINANA